MSAPLTIAAPAAPTATLEAHLRAIYRSEYRHLLHDADQDSTEPAFVVSLTKTRLVVAR